jgi:hypothetical protein
MFPFLPYELWAPKTQLMADLMPYEHSISASRERP